MFGMHSKMFYILITGLCFLLFFAGHPWVQEDGVAPDKPLDSAVLSRLTQVSAMNKLEKMALRVSATVTQPLQKVLESRYLFMFFV